MALEQLRSRISLILSQATFPVPLVNDRGHSVTFTIANKVVPDVVALVSTAERAAEAANEQVDLLKVLYSSLDEAGRQVFWDTLLTPMLWRRPHSAVVAQTIVELRACDKIPVPPQTLDGSQYESSSLFWNAIRASLSLQAPYFTDDDLMTVATKVTETQGRLPTLPTVDGGIVLQPRASAIAAELAATSATIRRVQYLRLKKLLLSSENPELNTDRMELLSRVRTLGFSQDVAVAFEEVEREVRSAGTPLDFKGCMDLLRTIFERLFQEATTTIAAHSGRAGPAGVSTRNFQPFKQHLVNERVLTDDEAEVMQKFYNYVSNTGTHKLGSDVEQVRVTRNTVIEWSLMIVGRVQRLVSAPAQ